MTALRLTNLTEAQIADALGFEDQDESTTLVLDEEDDVLVMPQGTRRTRASVMAGIQQPDAFSIICYVSSIVLYVFCSNIDLLLFIIVFLYIYQGSNFIYTEHKFPVKIDSYARIDI